ncbi:MAG: T9SS type A sorting domain-containing protein [Bacteroidales bacterium]|nr:T9SS type A sorting domain-containing protein [Bacteroidales bacterium]
MKYFYLFLVAAASIHTIGLGQEQLEQAPLNPEFKEYRESAKLKAQPEIKKNGYVPPPYKVSFQNFHKQNKTLKASQQLPASYDLRDEGYVTSVKNQEEFGTCWAFSSLGAIESRWKMLEGTAYDLSEKNMVTCSGYEWGPSDGGNLYMATAYLNRFDGPIDETLDPYDELTENSECTDYEPPVNLVPEARYLPNDIDEVKRIIRKYGAVATSMYAGDQLEYYNFNDDTWYYDGDAATNHGILIVGWDDNKVVENIEGAPDTQGAWIIKNSWGKDQNNNGYFYLAYKDSKVLTSNAFYPIKWDNARIDSLHYYDKLGMVTSLSYRDRDVLYGLTRFEAQTDETVKKVGTYINNYGSMIDITIYQDFDSENNQPLNPVDSIVDREILYPGYYTFDIKADITGEFYVKVKYDMNGYEYPLPVETSFSDYADPEIEESGTNWFSPDGEEWRALGADVGNPYDLCIRAYTRKKDPTASFGTDGNFYCISETVTFTNKSGGYINSYHWYFGDGAEPSETTGAGPHKVTYSTPGTKTISLTVEGSNGKDSISKVDHLFISENLHIFFDSPEKETSVGDTAELRVNGEAEQYVWSDEGRDEGGLVSTSGSTAWVTYDGDTEDTLKFTVTGSSGQCSDSDSILVAFSLGPENDDVCDAIEISPGMNGTFTNKHATVQPNEPMPDTSGSNSCTEPMKWCNEGGLHNTAWFKFNMPSDTGTVSFITSDMDTQIALYEPASECSDMLSGNFTMLAANDDYFGEENDYAAAIMDLENLNEGRTYWLQVDGSAGGVEGEFTIEIKGSAVGVDAPASDNGEIHVYPNPSSGHFSIIFKNKIYRDIQLEIFSIGGKRVYNEKLHKMGINEHHTVTTPEIQSGVYFLRIRSEENIYTKKLIVE